MFRYFEYYCSEEISWKLQEIGYDPYYFYSNGCPKITIYEAQSFLRNEGIIVYPVVDRYNDGEETTWQCEIYIPFLKLYRIGQNLSFEDALYEGIKEAVSLYQK